ncbi:MAG: hypothetical protein ACRDPL_17865, partial [Propionibacteriaceae bacterium]
MSGGAAFLHRRGNVGLLENVQTITDKVCRSRPSDRFQALLGSTRTAEVSMAMEMASGVHRLGDGMVNL